MSYTVVGLFNNRNDAQAAVGELTQRGFLSDNIDVSHKRAASAATDTTVEKTTAHVEVTDSVGNFFRSLFGDDESTARNYSSAAGDADAILTVHADSEDSARQAAEILDRNGAIDVDAAQSRDSQRNVAQTVETTRENTVHTAQAVDRNVESSESGTVIPIVEEQLHVGKRQVESGAARVRSRVIEKPVEASVRLREEHVVVERHAVNRAVTDADLANAKQGDINITEHAEVPVVAKEARVVEEVVIGKNVTEHTETVRDTVKRTDVDVEEVAADTTARRDDNRN